ncbi:MAG: multidrug ABC transporter [Ignavibacteria bacterium CG2_30_36_16]|nr:ABC transporter ATP-binding protein [Ignavibacteria bacterium]OIP62126.1 MAG: multidrug ABC transporter [Ignavibacteria bacterium CG2_30_36_16]PJB01934.1 MAG: ABC transporter ATP-binding protein [Ignavibacteria bacterium CG_4_9_14_3_um_filter_36_18]
MKTYFRILSYVRPYWKHLALSVVCTIFFAVLNGASVYLTIPLLDTLFQETPKTEKAIESPSTMESAKGVLPDWVKEIEHSITETFNNYVFSGDKLNALMKICILVLIAFLAKNMFGYMQAYFLAYVEQGTMKDLRDAAYRHLHELPMSYFKKERVGNLISRITNDVNVIQSSISAAFLNMIREPLSIIVFLGIAVSISWRLTLLALVILPFSMLIIAWIGLKLRKQSAVIQAKMADITSILQETISGVKIVKAFGMESYENKKFSDETRSFFKMMLRIVRIRNASSPITEFLSVVVGVVIIYYGGVLVLEENTIKASQFLGFLFAIFQMMPPIKELSSVNNRIQESSAAGDRIFEILDTKPAISNIKNPKSLTGFNSEIVFNNVSFHYEDSEELVLKKLNFSVKQGEILALVGPSGGGKSTLVDLLPRFYDPTEGKILIDGIDTKETKLEDLRALMGIVTQETILFNVSVTNNIAYGLKNYSFEKVVDAAKAANAHNFIMELPKEYDTIIGERGLKVSGGQRQRLSIARAILKNPKIMIFDEATSALDNESELLVQEAIERMMVNRTTFVIAHRLSTIRNATRILVLEKGKIIQEGKHEELIKDEKGLYYKFYEMQFRD